MAANLKDMPVCEQELFVRYRIERTKELRNEIVDTYMYIPEILSRRFANRGIEYEDIFHQPIDDKIIKVFEKWEQKKLCKIKKEFSDSIRYSLGKNGILFLNAFLEEII